jgi:phosphatidylserine/phosphatidylglycerophosphate/cardiolipin synthase-like enzyme
MFSNQKNLNPRSPMQLNVSGIKVIEDYFLSYKNTKKIVKRTKLKEEEKNFCKIAFELLNKLVPEKQNQTLQLIHRMLTIARLFRYYQEKQSEVKHNQHKLLGVRKLIDLLISPKNLQSHKIQKLINKTIGDISWIDKTVGGGRLENIIEFAALERQAPKQNEEKLSLAHWEIYSTISTLYNEGKYIPKNDYHSELYSAYYKTKSKEKTLSSEESVSRSPEFSESSLEDQDSTFSSYSPSPLNELTSEPFSPSEKDKDINFVNEEEKEKDEKIIIKSPDAPTPIELPRSEADLSKWVSTSSDRDSKKDKEPDQSYYKKIQNYIQSSLNITLTDTEAKKEARKFSELKESVGKYRASRILLCNVTLSKLHIHSSSEKNLNFLSSIISEIRDQLLYNQYASPIEILDSICNDGRLKFIVAKLGTDPNRLVFQQLRVHLNSKIEKEDKPNKDDHDYGLLAESCEENYLLSNYFSSLDKNEQIHANNLFKPREGNQIIEFYSNAYNNEHSDSGAYFDICQDIEKAKELIVITGWTLRLDWNMGMTDDKTLLQRILDAAKRNVKICILVWDVSRFIDVHNKDLENISKKIIEMAKEQKIVGIEKNLFLKVAHRELGYSDHAKIIIIDSQKMYAGGLDLTIDRENPRTWHDCHVAISGPMVQDALTLIKARWTVPTSTFKFPEPSIFSKDIISAANDISLKALEKSIEHSMTFKSEEQKKDHPTSPAPSATPTMQLLTSIKRENWNSQAGEWKVANHYTNEIARAYVKTIQEAEHFIYMENQYFVGPRYQDNHKKTENPKNNPVIAEIVKKIIQKHRDKEDFHFYCQLPYIPDGNDSTKTVTNTQVRKTWKTVDWFRQEVDIGTHGNSNKYITFYHLGQYDEKHKGFLQKYTHSKLLIADDKQLIIGSANCNERSMAGNRDHEMVILMKNHSDQIKAYRIALMKEHFGHDIEKRAIIMNNPETQISALILHEKADRNVAMIKSKKDIDHAKNGYAVGYGLLTRKEFLNGKRPDHVPARSKLITQPKVVSKVVR